MKIERKTHARFSYVSSQSLRNSNSFQSEKASPSSNHYHSAPFLRFPDFEKLNKSDWLRLPSLPWQLRRLPICQSWLWTTMIFSRLSYADFIVVVATWEEDNFRKCNLWSFIFFYLCGFFFFFSFWVWV